MLDFAEMPDRLRVAQVLLYTGPDGRMYFAPLGTPDPDPDRALDAEWVELSIVRESNGVHWPPG
ncbi:hypothetical protein [Micromonospora sp. NPDC004551]|uniref:hypothetical protein n=1 Tax=Micromonospora sp. NPDC004551 TaxID=3154284 RepID=UPI0033AA1077